MTKTTDRLAEVPENLLHMTTEMRGNYDGEYDHWADRIDTAADLLQSLSADLDKAQEEIEALRKSGAAILDEKHKEAREGVLWFTRAQEWKQQLKTVLDREAATHARHDAKVDALEARVEGLLEELKLWDALVDDEGGCPRYNVQRGAALNTVVTSTKALLRVALNHGKESGNEG